MTNEQMDMLVTLIKNTKLNASEHFIEGVLKRLGSFGYEVNTNDVWLITFAIDKVTQKIKSNCNVSEIPDGLKPKAIDMIVAEVLMGKYTTGQLDIDTLDLGGAIASISEGDTSVSFDSNASDDVKFTSLMSVLSSEGGEFSCYRRIKW